VGQQLRWFGLADAAVADRDVEELQLLSDRPAAAKMVGGTDDE
jgi:hypothetical protein